MAAMIDPPLFTWKLHFPTRYHDHISLFQAHLHICKEFLELSADFPGGFYLWIIFLALAPWILMVLVFGIIKGPNKL
jgi:hypothetical protein